MAGQAAWMRGLVGAAIALALVCAIALAAGAVDRARAQYPDEDVARPNPCVGSQAKKLRCPDLRMRAPSDMSLGRNHGRLLLHATNDIRSRGEGPLEIHGTRSGKRTMSVRQGIYTTSGKRKLFATSGSLVFYPVPGQGHYWKFHEAATFEIWSVNAEGKRQKLLRTGPKLNYCFRDLVHTGSHRRGPRQAVYPGCSQNPHQRHRTLGTSVGWSDVYPSTYHENWVNVTGLRGCFLFVHRADPDNYLFENNEHNNEGKRLVRLTGGRRVRSC